MFWDEPKEWNGDVMLGYVIRCVVEDEGGNGEMSASPISGNVSFKHTRAFSFVVKSGKISCLVAATNEQNLIGAFSPPAIIDGSGNIFKINFILF